MSQNGCQYNPKKEKECGNREIFPELKLSIFFCIITVPSASVTKTPIIKDNVGITAGKNQLQASSVLS
jgi:hypothetical protein